MSLAPLHTTCAAVAREVRVASPFPGTAERSLVARSRRVDGPMRYHHQGLDNGLKSVHIWTYAKTHQGHTDLRKLRSGERIQGEGGRVVAQGRRDGRARRHH